jgi:alpha,alpha-trehalose-phosphate synthase [UDP-forming]/trehalose-phosphatase
MPTIPWHDIATGEHLGILVDLDGTLIPFAPTLEDAVFDDASAALLASLSALSGLRVAVVSGRPRASIEAIAPRVPTALWVAEHGGWRLGPGGWQSILPVGDDLAGIERTLRAHIALAPGARLERKTFSVCVHWRSVAEPARTILMEVANLAIDEWLEEHPTFERMPASEALEVRHRAVHKGSAVAWLRAQMPAGARLLAIGDDATDEDMFAALGPDDVGVKVDDGRGRTRARAAVDGVVGARVLLAWIATHRLGGDAGDPPVRRPAHRIEATASGASLVVVSNRLPAAPAPTERKREAGGLVSALEPALIARKGLWLGWSGLERDPGLDLQVEPDAVPARASFDYPTGWREHFYSGFCNQSLWPLLHCFPSRLRYVDDEWTAYVAANRAYAEATLRLVAPGGTVWVHDYHLFLAGAELRRLGHTGPIGFFLHVPFPPLDIMETMPWAKDLVEGLLAHDLVGFHTTRWTQNFIASARALCGAEVHDGYLRHQGRMVHVGVFPVGIEPSAFSGEIHDHPSPESEALRGSLEGRALVLGVDRLDYSKGIPQRLEAFGRLLALYPEWRGKVSFIQVSVPSRSDVPEYAELRHRVENLVGHINGDYGEAHWVPVRYLYRSYDQQALAQLYRAARVGMVTPLRDGMNLVAKEYVAAQDPANPGVLLLSRFAGAADELSQALLTNPYHPDGMATDLDRALRMPLDERRRRHAACLAPVERATSTVWADRFLARLDACRR